MVLHKILNQYVSSYQRWIKSVITLGNHKVLKTLTKTLTFVDADANVNANAAAEARSNTTALHESCSGEQKWTEQQQLTNVYVIWLLKLEIYWKYCGKEEKLLLSNLLLDFHV